MCAVCVDMTVVMEKVVEDRRMKIVTKDRASRTQFEGDGAVHNKDERTAFSKEIMVSAAYISTFLLPRCLRDPTETWVSVARNVIKHV